MFYIFLCDIIHSWILFCAIHLLPLKVTIYNISSQNADFYNFVLKTKVNIYIVAGMVFVYDVVCGIAYRAFVIDTSIATL